MKIGKKSGNVGGGSFIKRSGGNDTVSKQGTGTMAPKGDNVDISVARSEINKIKGMLDSLPEVRGEMVVRLKTDIERGSYHVDSGKVAEKLIERAVRDALYKKQQ